MICCRKNGKQVKDGYKQNAHDEQSFITKKIFIEVEEVFHSGEAANIRLYKKQKPRA